MIINKQSPMERGAGILLPVSSLPSPYGIGSFGKHAYEFVDFLKRSGQKYWQVLPLGPTSYGDSPYQSFSAFAGNPYFIDLDVLISEGLLTQSEVNSVNWDNGSKVDYAQLFKERFKLLRAAFKRSKHEADASYRTFCDNNSFWLKHYSSYMAIKTHFGHKAWQCWPEDIRLRQPDAVEKYNALLLDDISFWSFCQYKFFEQWLKLKSYANENGIEIIGDIPIYVAMDSSDVWVNFELFDLDNERRPRHVAGVPPDMFSSTGQLWGNPIYNWDRMEQDGFSWWKERMKLCAQLYDVIRIDHFIGIVNFYRIPAKDNTAMNGCWIQGPGEKLVAAINSAIGNKKIIAEDLGVVTPEVIALLEKSGYPGMKLMEMGFESDASNENLPCHFDKNCVVYGGTHDNETLVGYFSQQDEQVLEFARNYLDVACNSAIPWAIIKAAYQSAANTVIFQLQDLLGLDNSARINTPSTLGGNWLWRLIPGQVTASLEHSLKRLTELYGR